MFNQALDEEKEAIEMRKLQILGAAFFAVLAFGAISAANALAVQWLENGAAMNKAEHAVTEGTWLLRGLAFFGIAEVHIVCNGILLGTVGPGAADLVSAVTDLNGNATLHCEILLPTSGCLSDLALVTAENLPWETELLEPKAGEIVDHFREDKANPKGPPAFKVECELKTGSETSESCLATTILTDPLVNLANGTVLGEVLNQLSDSCNTSGTVSHIYGHGVIKLLSGAKLEVSK